MVLGYLRHIGRDLKCMEGCHEWREWNADAGKRLCKNCGLEMPESKQGEKNYISGADYSEVWLKKTESDYDCAKRNRKNYEK